MRQAVLKTLTEHGRKGGLEKFEIPTKLTLIETPWTAEMGLVTAALPCSMVLVTAVLP